MSLAGTRWVQSTIKHFFAQSTLKQCTAVEKSQQHQEILKKENKTALEIFHPHQVKFYTRLRIRKLNYPGVKFLDLQRSGSTQSNCCDPDALAVVVAVFGTCAVVAVVVVAARVVVLYPRIFLQKWTWLVVSVTDNECCLLD